MLGLCHWDTFIREAHPDPDAWLDERAAFDDAFRRAYRVTSAVLGPALRAGVAASGVVARRRSPTNVPRRSGCTGLPPGRVRLLASGRAQHVEHSAARKARIVVINDDRPFLDLMEQLLQDLERYDVETRREWDGAYEFVKERRPDLVVLDIRIGGEERGWQILQLLTLDPETLPIPVIVCSAAIDDLQAHQALLDKYGVRVLPKPFDLDDLLETVAASLRAGPRAVAE